MKFAELIELCTASLGDLPRDASIAGEDENDTKTRKLSDILGEARILLGEDDPSLLKKIGRELGKSAIELGKGYAGAATGLVGGAVNAIGDLGLSDAIMAKLKGSAEFSKWQQAIAQKYPSGITFQDDVSADGQSHTLNAIINDTGTPEIVARFNYTDMKIIPTMTRIPVKAGGPVPNTQPTSQSKPAPAQPNTKAQTATTP